VGAAGAWVLLNGVYMLVGVPLTHRKLLRGQTRAWFAVDVLPPVATSLLVVAVGRALVTRASPSPLGTILSVAFVFLLAAGAATSVAPLVRRALRDWLGRSWSMGHR
jgi:hypothetical protein